MADLNGARVFITGGAGFIGSHIADQVLASGAASVVVLDDFSRGRFENLGGAAATGRLEVIEGDIRDRRLVDRLAAGADLIFHQAALRITQAAEEPQRAIEVMINGTQHVLDAAVTHRVKKVLSASSASVYGEASRLPMDESHPFNNRTLYGACKVANEQLLRSFNDMYGLPYVALRYFNVYGPRMDAWGVYTEVMIRWLQRLEEGKAPIIFGDGLQTMDFIFVRDIADANVRAMLSDTSDTVCNVATGAETSLAELCMALCAAAGRPDLEPIFEPARKVNPVTRRLGGIEHARNAIGFEASTGLADGLTELVEWFATLPKLELAAAR